MAASAPAWTVTQQVETMDLGPSGTFVSGVKVTVRTAAGDTLSVFVPADQYDAATVTAAIVAKVATANAIRAAGPTG